MSQEPLFAQRDFRLLLLGQAASQLGTQISGIAVPLLAVVTLHASSLGLGLINAASTAAFVVLGLPVGVWVDRRRRRRLLVASDVARAALLASIPVAAWLGMLSQAQVVVVSLLVGAARVVFDVGYQSYIPSLVGRDQVLAGNSSMELARACGQVVGPGVGGALVSLLGAASVVLAQAVGFGVSAAAIAAIRRKEAEPAGPPARPTLRADVAEGLAFVARQPILRATALASAAGNVSFAVASAVYVIFLSRTLGLTPTAIGVVVAVGSVTAMLGAFLTPWLSRRVGSARLIWASLALTTPLTLAVPLARPGWSVWLVLAGAAAGELGQIVYAIANVSLRQRLVPDQLLGRVNATLRVVIMGLLPVGAVFGGVLGALAGPRATLLVAGSIALVGPVVLERALRGVREVEEVVFLAVACSAPVQRPISGRRELEAAAAEVAWWHSIELAPGFVTNGIATTAILERELAGLHLPDLRGKTVLDIGAWDGYYSFAAERAGAARVVAVDYLTWSIDLPAFNAYVQGCQERGEPAGDVRYLPELGLWQPESLPGKRGFDLAREALHSSVEPLVADFLDLDPATVGSFDVVLFLGVIYHLKDPVGAAEQLRRLTGELAVVESEAIHVPGQEHLALWRFHGVDQLHGGGNWWVPNRRALEHVLLAAGFTEVETVDTSALVPTETEATHYRIVVHARP